MLRTLLKLQLKNLLHSTKRQKENEKKQPRWAVGLLAGFLALCVELLFFSVWVLLSTLIELGLGWVYFAIVGISAVSVAVLGSVFLTQSTLYDAKDNDLLLSMPIPPRDVLLSRMASLLIFTFVFVAGALLPAYVSAWMFGGFAPWQIPVWLLLMLALTLLTQSFCCALGFLLNRLLRHLKNKAIAALIGMAAFFAVYFALYSKVMSAITEIDLYADDLSAALGSFSPAVALGNAFLGNVWDVLGVTLCGVLCFAAVVVWLSRTFRSSVGSGNVTVRREKSKTARVRSAQAAVAYKERRRFFTSPVYLTNLGFGLVLLPILPVAAFIFRKDLLYYVGLLGLSPFLAPVAALLFGFLIVMSPITAPSVSLEGKNLWVLRSLPVSGKTVLLGKLRLHCVCTAPLSALSALALGAVLGCGVFETLLLAVFCGALAAAVGVFGLLGNLLLPRFDWANESWPCKQSGAMMLSIFGGYAVLLILAGVYFACAALLPGGPGLALGVCTAVVCAAGGLGFYALCTWGAARFESF